MFGRIIAWVEDELTKLGIGGDLVKKVLPVILVDVLQGKSAQQILDDVLNLFRTTQA